MVSLGSLVERKPSRFQRFHGGQNDDGVFWSAAFQTAMQLDHQVWTKCHHISKNLLNTILCP